MRGLVVLALVATASVAHADGVVLESYTGDRPADAARLLAPVLEELASRKYAAGDAVARQFDRMVSRASSVPLPTDFAAQVDKGFKAWVGGRFDEAIAALGQLVESAHASSATFAADPARREPLQRALIALALAQQRIGDQGAMRATFAELVRSFADAQVPRATYGPDAQQAFEQVRRDLQGGSRGKLTVEVTDDTAVVFLNEAYRSVGSTTAELVPGEYRVVVVANKQPSRTHRATVTAGGNVTVEVDPAWDRTIRTTGYTGLSFATQADRDANEAASAARFARSIGASAVVVVGIDDVRGKSAVVGSLVSLESGREIRRASIPIEPDPSTERLRALARFLTGEDPVAGLDVQFANPYDRDIGNKREAPEPDKPRWGGWRWLTGTIGVAGLATGAVLLALDGRCPSDPPAGQPCPDVYATATPGLILLGAGAVFTGIAVYLFATHPSAKVAPVVAPTSGGAAVGFLSRW
jgi:hypothetical protein